MIARTFVAVNFVAALAKSRELGMWGQLMPLGNQMWICWED